ncbi:MAG: hypothetical protein NTX91_05400 [candidate division SR1 bacterium]|nr:hypothetical protein [candidate division SR1 bacterium]
MKRNKKTISIVLYVIWLIILLMRIATRSFADVGLYLILALDVLIIKDVLLYLVKLKPTKKIGIGNLESGTGKQELKIGRLHRYLLYNRAYIFPVVLVMYLIYLLIKQTHVWNMQNTIPYLIINESVLLGIVIISGILTIWKEDKDKQYQVVSESMRSTYISIGLSIFLSLLGTYIIYGQIMQLGRIAYIISAIAGVLIFLIGVMIVEEDGKMEDGKMENGKWDN